MLSIILISLTIIFLIIIILYLLFLHNVSSQNNISHQEEEEITPPTMHAKCYTNHGCGGDLTCDVVCSRCKKKIGGNCASDVDCETGLVCRSWKCSDNLDNLTDNTIMSVKHSNKHIQWANNDEIYPIPKIGHKKYK